MKLLIDNAVSPLVAHALRDDGHDVVHVRDLGLAAATDIEVFEAADAQDRVLVSADTDFGAILAMRNAARPSVILLRHPLDRGPERQAQVLLTHLPSFQQDLESGSVIVIEEGRIRIRALPIGE